MIGLQLSTVKKVSLCRGHCVEGVTVEVVRCVYWTGVLYALDWCFACTGLMCCM